MKGILLIVFGTVLTLMSLLLLLVERWALAGIALGILAIVYGRKDKKGSAAHVKKLLEEGRIASMLITITGGPYKTAYLNEDDRPRTTKGDLNFSAVLEISVK